MNDLDPPYWVPLPKPENQQKEESRKNSPAEQKIGKGYLICKSQYEALEEFQKMESEDDGINLSKKENKQIPCIKCPFTGDLVEK